LHYMLLAGPSAHVQPATPSVHVFPDLVPKYYG
jgi:hypothetical protein